MWRLKDDLQLQSGAPSGQGLWEAGTRTGGCHRVGRKKKWQRTEDGREAGTLRGLLLLRETMLRRKKVESKGGTWGPGTGSVSLTLSRKLRRLQHRD